MLRRVVPLTSGTRFSPESHRFMSAFPARVHCCAPSGGRRLWWRLADGPDRGACCPDRAGTPAADGSDQRIPLRQHRHRRQRADRGLVPDGDRHQRLFDCPLQREPGNRGRAVHDARWSGRAHRRVDGFALVDPSGAVVELLSYAGVLTAASGPAAGRTSEDVLVTEPRTAPVGSSIQRNANDIWAYTPGTNTFGACNDDGPAAPIVPVATITLTPTGGTLTTTPAPMPMRVMTSSSAAASSLPRSAGPGTRGTG